MRIIQQHPRLNNILMGVLCNPWTWSISTCHYCITTIIRWESIKLGVIIGFANKSWQRKFTSFCTQHFHVTLHVWIHHFSNYFHFLLYGHICAPTIHSPRHPPAQVNTSTVELETKAIRRCAKVIIVSYSRSSLMIFASRTKFHVERPWGQRPFSIVS